MSDDPILLLETYCKVAYYTESKNINVLIITTHNLQKLVCIWVTKYERQTSYSLNFCIV